MITDSLTSLPPAAEWLTTTELARRWKVCRMTIHRKVKAKEIKVHMLGKRSPRFSLAEIAAYEQAQ